MKTRQRSRLFGCRKGRIAGRISRSANTEGRCPARVIDRALLHVELTAGVAIFYEKYSKVICGTREGEMGVWAKATLER